MIKAGELDRLVIFKQNTPTQNDFGELENVWSTLDTVWASVRPAKQEEKFSFEQSAAFEQTVFVVRYQERLKDYELQIIHDGKTFDVTGIKELGRREALMITAKAQV